MSSHRELYARRPDLRRYNSLERFTAMRVAAGGTGDVDLSGAHALRDAIIEFDPEIHELPRSSISDALDLADSAGREEGRVEEAPVSEETATEPAHAGRKPALDPSGHLARIPVDRDGNVYAASFRPSSRDVASLVDVSETVEPGDVLVIDRAFPGMMRRGFEAHDTGVVGVVATDAGVVLGSQPSDSDESASAAGAAHRAAVALAGVVGCKVDAGFGAIWPGDLLVTSPTPGHAMRADAPLPGTMVGKALEPLGDGTGTIRVLVMLR